MSPRFVLFAGAAALAAAAPAAAQAPIGPDAAACRGGGPAILVNVRGFKNATGTVRVQLHGDNAATWLERGKYMKRIELPVPANGVMPVCVRVPGPGRYAIAVRHDMDGDGKMTANDGGGFSRNPRLSVSSLRPRYQDVSFQVGEGVQSIDVVMNYRYGLTIRPVR
ncbi:MAG: DUF2141 domain-containing protein [Allosphingosinicella sp.]|uniref:DUF2141 domain-containing protein n=1 Tax=Allosphingosinicella sp. TaxID=2823234 RepID=UPI0039590F80